jgi:hypothetical protein
VSVILLLRRNPLRRLVSLQANKYDQEAKLVGGEHVSHVYSREEVRPSLGFFPSPQCLQFGLMPVKAHVHSDTWTPMIAVGLLAIFGPEWNISECGSR